MTVQSFTTLMVGKTFLPVLGSLAFFSVASRSALVRAAPLWKVTPARRTMVQLMLSGAMVKLWARAGMGLPVSSYSISVS